MTPGSHARPTPDVAARAGADGPGSDPGSGGDGRPPRSRRAWSWWRVGTPLMILLSGGLFVVSAESSQGTDLRPGRYTDLASLVSNEADDYAALQRRVADMTAEVKSLSSSVADRGVKRYQREVEQLEDPAGLTPRSGPGLTVTLSDASEDVIETTSEDLNRLIVHQQDIQAVVNAMWKAGATAVTVQGQRVVSTTGIKCEGNAVQLQGVPYSQPYVISAVGDQEQLTGEIYGDDYLAYYRRDAADPDIAVGWDVALEDNLVAPAYEGLLAFRYAEPIR